MNDYIKAFSKALIDHLKNEKPNLTFHAYVQDGYCSTCWSETSVDGIDMDDLYDEIDKFAASFNKDK